MPTDFLTVHKLRCFGRLDLILRCFGWLGLRHRLICNTPPENP